MDEVWEMEWVKEWDKREREWDGVEEGVGWSGRGNGRRCGMGLDRGG